ncbi:NADH/Ubiquinone/plastoquinone [Natrinema pellirubrum DSM 15624]|uniref:NADH/Ubiquinone/plastoquinone n=1 Tax=Natrinema pellirubrum (strain DSM 15624 / CIP 106293 / JCM 10476 / NCIMB 786 / 157) TaxID=797303 RepID=L0JLA8_NATP1|nr:hydrogen gas-evolving membrane-bound hydrogenase subunit E [Natrinema pellirubrum]AGB31352.1 NADH:ubiquinone oxidoreductase subunit 5 (chain L)/multisubunit Na+/H+ antiporter, MnhA subunit [Natrinema pellirubrum DSM 15624]ELY81712.1 NADH/Ubiquinone/plastoquinone [Natrinema pellirubrum DSM 15624]
MSPDLAVVVAAVALPFVAAALTPLVFRLLGETTGFVGTVVSLASFGLLATQYGTEGSVSLEWISSLNIALRFYVDGWALLFAMLATGIGALVFTYSPAYMHGQAGLPRYYAALLAFMGSIVGVALAADLVAIFLFWELTSLCSFVLIGYYTADDSSQYAARMAMFITVGGGLFLLVGLLLLSIVAGDVLGPGAAFDLATMLENPETMSNALRERGLFLPVLGLLAIGAGTKSAQVPVHFWLPNAMAAPTPVSAFLHSATMVKVGVYFIGRIRPMLVGEEWLFLFATLGLTTMTVCAIMAVAATDIKELLAYSTASHLGLMVAGFGFTSVYGAETGVFHLLNHALFKAALFLVAGIIAHEAGTREIRELGGLRHDLPVTAAITGVVALSMAGIPPFNGFYSKELLFEAAVEASHYHEIGLLGWLYPAVAVFGSIFTVLYSLKFLSLFFGERPEALGHVHRPNVSLLVPPAVLALLAAIVSVDPQRAVDLVVQSGLEATAVDPHAMHVGLPTSYSTPVGMSAVTIGAGVLAYPSYGRIHDGIRAGLAAIPPIRANWWYDRIVEGLTDEGRLFAEWVHNGHLRTYATWTLAATCALALTGFVAAGAIVPATIGLEVTIPIALVLLVAVVGAVAVARADSHIAGILTLSILGFMIAIFYILASAPDLALTQLVVETLVLVIFLLVVEEIPERYEIEVGRVARDAVLSVAVGVTVFVTILVTTDARPDGPTEIARAYAERAVPGGGGTNIVNVTLVDFRGFDTLGELAVIALASISILTLIVMRGRGDASPAGDDPSTDSSGGDGPTAADASTDGGPSGGEDT